MNANRPSLRIKIPNNKKTNTRTRTPIARTPSTSVSYAQTPVSAVKFNTSNIQNVNIKQNNKAFNIKNINYPIQNTYTRSRSSSLTKSNPVSVVSSPVVGSRISVSPNMIKNFTGVNTPAANKTLKRSNGNAFRIQKPVIKNWNKPVKRTFWNPTTWFQGGSKTRKLRK